MNNPSRKVLSLSICSTLSGIWNTTGSVPRISPKFANYSAADFYAVNILAASRGDRGNTDLRAKLFRPCSCRLLRRKVAYLSSVEFSRLIRLGNFVRLVASAGSPRTGEISLGDPRVASRASTNIPEAHPLFTADDIPTRQ